MSSGEADWRPALLASPDFQAARAEVGPVSDQIQELQKLTLPAHHVWLSLQERRGQSHPLADKGPGFSNITPFDASNALYAFLRELGFGQQAPPETATLAGLAQEDLCDQPSLALLVSVLSQQQMKTLRLDHLSPSPVSDDSNTFTSTWLNVLATVSLKPYTTQLVLYHFRPLFLDLAARWLHFVGFNGESFSFEHPDATRATVFLVFNAFAQTLEYNWALFPLLQVLLRHPLVSQDPFDLLSPTFKAQDLSRFNQCPPPTSSQPEQGMDDLFGHPQLLPLLWSLHRLLTCDQALPFQNGLQGWRYPLPLLEACMKRHPNIGFRLLAWRVYRLWANLITEDGEKLLHQWVAQPDAQGHSPPWPKFDTAEEEISFRQHPVGQAGAKPSRNGVASVLVQQKVINAWLISTEEQLHAFHFLKRFQPIADTLPATPVISATAQPSSGSNEMDLDAPEGGLSITSEDLSSFVALIAGNVLLPKERPLRGLLADTTLQTPPHFVLTEPATRALQSLALHFFSRTPILLTAAPAAGKSSMIAHLAASLGSASVVSISLADRSIDAKSLLGSLSSSSTNPGTFTFIEGSLTRCLKQGKWLVLDDIEMAAPDVLALISTLAERMRERALYMPAGAHGGLDGEAGVGVMADGRWIAAREGFALFATSSNNTTPPRWLGSQFWTQVSQDELSLDDMAQVIAASHHKISAPLLQEMLGAWETIFSSQQPGHRQNTFRDLFKWCRRVNSLVPASAAAATTFRRNPTFQEESFLEAVDVFFGSHPDLSSEASQLGLNRLTEALGLSVERGTWLLQGRTPECIFPTAADATRNSRMKVGRITLSRQLQPLSKTARPFALTRPSLGLMERLAVCAHFVEPVLLVGETGTGKTTTVSQLAMLLGHELISLNMSNQSEASDLIGGFKPIDLSSEAQKNGHDLVNVFSDLFDRTFGLSRNTDFISAVRQAMSKKRWPRLVALWREACKMAKKKTQPKGSSDSANPNVKRRKTDLDGLAGQWQQFKDDVSNFEARFASGSAQEAKLSFAFVEGPLVKAIQQGHWILLDEINLASAETLESIGALLSSADASLVVTERGDLEPVTRHPNFRIFACMNPATDVGKRDLPPSLRAKLTEVYVPPPDTDRASLLAIIEQYIGQCSIGDKGIVSDVADLYSKIKSLALASQLADGANAPPHYSVRTLARALTFASDHMGTFGLRRAVYEGFVMTFTMLLDAPSISVVSSLIRQQLFRNDDQARAVLSKTPESVAKRDREAFAAFHHFKLARGYQADDANVSSRYVITPSVKDKITNLARVVSAQRYPVLIQGPTSSGKTSIIEYLAARTGHRFVRINNHEHTDIQEYLGTYTSDPQTGKLVFREGLLVQALRRGDWIVLDELNLAPTDVLEALNRLLDDNRELVIPETQEVVRPHPHFMLFATQNPPNSFYGGRKALSRAFRNRFLELHFDDVPRGELESILETRCRIAPSYAKKIVAVFDELQHRRQSERVFEEKQSFATLRDLFRWGGREAVGYEELARNGYLLIAERARSPEDRQTVREVLERVLKVRIDTDHLYATAPTSSSNLVWTSATRRLFTLVSEAVKFGEPVLLVGDTGTGKTSVCQQLAADLGLPIRIVNCHLNTDAADILGGYRPARAPEATAMFEWHDGPLVESMKEGGFFLMDEISLADDSVLERLNSVLEPAKTLVLAEKGGSNLDELLIHGRPDFHVLATMNPGGDFGKKELSPALRNRFTEIWVPAIDSDEDLLQIIRSSSKNNSSKLSSADRSLAQHILDFSKWFATRFLDAKHVTLRSLLAWINFVSVSPLDSATAFVHGALMTLVDGLGSLPSMSTASEEEVRLRRSDSIQELLRLAGLTSVEGLSAPEAVDSPSALAVGPFSIAKTSSAKPRISNSFNLAAPTPRENVLRLLRALQIPKPVLLEGSPGVGKTSLVAALAEFTGQEFVRINLSDQTDLADLFGSDMPVDGGAPGQFAWRDAPFLTALRSGHWVLLDEMNLAPQPVLEGLNSCLDHRGEAYIPELGRTFKRHPAFRIFAAQNPTHQGGSRKGLPKSFVDRFTQVFVAPLQRNDLLSICTTAHSALSAETVQQVVDFAIFLSESVNNPTTAFGSSGSPWDFNLRDILRWLSLLQQASGIQRLPSNPAEFLDLCVVQGFRNDRDRAFARRAAVQFLGYESGAPRATSTLLSPTLLASGHSLFSRSGHPFLHRHQIGGAISSMDQELVQSIIKACERHWLVVLTGDQGAGKSSLLRSLASATGNRLDEFNVSNQTDALELLGSYEQASWAKAFHHALDFLESHCLSTSTLETDPSGILSARAMILAIRSLRGQVNASSHDPQDLLLRLQELANTLRVEEPEVLDAVMAPLVNFASRGVFQWEDGPLVEAVVKGHWFAIDNANLCPGSVLDRLNSLVEPNGFLLLNEHAKPSTAAPILKPHPNFRLFLSYNPKFGELSRAMRNRGVELHVAASTKDSRPRHPSTRVTALSRADQCAQQLLEAALAKGPCRQALVPLPASVQATSLLARVPAPASAIYASLPFEACVEATKAAYEQVTQVLRLPAQLADMLSVDTLYNYATHSVDRVAALALQSQSRKLTCALSLVAASAAHASIPDSPFQAFSTSLKAESLKRFSQDASEATYSDQELVFLFLEIQEQLQQERLDHAMLQELLSWAEQQLRRADVMSSFSKTLTLLSQVKKQTHLQQGQAIAQLWSTLFVSPNAALWQSRRGLSNAIRTTAELPPDLSQLCIEVGAALQDSAGLQGASLERLGRLAETIVQRINSTRSGQDAFTEPIEELALLRDLAVQRALCSSPVNSYQINTTAFLSSRTLLANQALLEELQSSPRATADVGSRMRVTGHAITNIPVQGDLTSPLAQTIQFLHHVSEAPLNRATEAREALERTSNALIAASRAWPSSVLQLSRDLARTLFGEIFEAITSTAAPANTSIINIARQAESTQPRNAFGSVCHDILANEHIQNTLLQPPSESMAAATECFVVASALWKLFVTNVPFDPAVALLARTKSLSWRRQQLIQSIAYHHMRDSRLALPKSEALWQDLQINDRQLSDQGNVPYVPRPQDGQRTLQSLFEELQAADQRFFALSQLNSLLAEASTSQGDSDISALSTRLESSLSSLMVINTRLAERFSSIEDLSHPPQIATALLIAGYRHLLEHITAKAASPATRASLQLLRSAVLYPPSESARQVGAHHDEGHSVLPAHTSAIIQLQAVAYGHRVQPHLDQRQCSHVTGLYRRLYSSWDALRKRAEAEAIESESVYRPRANALADLPADTTEEEEVNALFGDASKSNVEATTTKKLKQELEEASLSAAQSHLVIFGQQASHQPLAQRFRTERQKVLTSLQSHLDSQLYLVDEYASAFNIESITSRLQSLQETDQLGSNFYKHPAPESCQPTLAVTRACAVQVGALLEEFPDQMILQDLLERLEALADLPLHSPPRRVLSAVESLLPVIEDWESVASKSRSLGEHKAALIQQVIRFRQMELKSWPALLRDEEEAFKRRALVWCMELLELVLGSQDSRFSASPGERAAFLQQATQLAQEFLSTSPRGQFTHRLQLLRSFAHHAQQLDDKALSNVLSAVGKAHEHLTTGVEEAVRVARQAASKGIHDQIQLATWKDVNIHALQQSSQKSHHALYKVIRSYRVELQAPAVGQNVKPTEASSANATSLLSRRAASPDQSTTCPEMPSSQTHLDAQQISITLRKLSSIVAGQRVAIESDSDPAQNLSAYTSSLKELVVELRQSPITGKDDEDKAKHAASLLTQKKRAVAESLKELKRLGLSHNPASVVTEGQQSLSTLYAAGSLDEKAQQALKESLHLDNGFIRLVEKLPKARLTPGQHHEDVSSRDVIKMVGALESGLALVLSLRRESAQALDIYYNLVPYVQRLEWASRSDLQLAKSSRAHTIETYLHGAARVCEALRELASSLDSHGQHVPDVEEVSAAKAAVQDLQQQLSTSAGSLQMFVSRQPLPAECQFRLETELAIISHISATITRVAQMLSQLARSTTWAYLLQPVAELAESVAQVLEAPQHQSSTVSTDIEDVRHAHEEVLSSVLLTAQDFARLGQTGSEDSEQSELDKSACILETKRQLSRLQALRLPGLIQKLQAFFQSVAQAQRHQSPDQGDLIPKTLQRTNLFMQAFVDILISALQSSAQWQQSLVGLLDLSTSTLLELSDKGFCRPQESEEDAQGGQGEGELELSEGTGMGSGSGAKDVSDQIEGEEQVAGLQNEQEEEKPEDGEDQGDGIEMSGGLEGLADDAEAQDVEQQSDQEDNDDDQDDQQDDVEDAVDDVDPLASTAVDEKFWGDEDQEKKDNKSGNEQVDQQTEQQQQETGDMGEKQENGAKQDQQQKQDTEAQEQDDEEGAPEEEQETDQAQAQTEQDQVAMPEGENLDMPEDLDLDLQDEQQAETQDDQMDLDQDPLDNTDKPMSADDDEPEKEGSDEDDQGQEVNDVERGDDDQQEDADLEGALDSAAGNTEQQEQPGDHSQGAGSGGVGEQSTEAKSKPEEMPERSQEAAPEGASGGGDDEAQGQAVATDPEGRPDPNVKATSQPDPSQAKSQRQQEQQSQLDEDRQLGDAVEQWTRRLEALDATKDEGQEPLGQDSTDLQYVHDDQTADQQALGPAQINQATAASNLRLEEETGEEETEEDAQQRQLDDTEMENDARPPEQPAALELGQMTQETSSTKDATQATSLTSAEIRKSSQLEQSESQAPAPDTMAAAHDNLPDEAEVDLDEEQQEVLDQQLLSWQTSDKQAMSTTAAWSSYLSLTRPASFALTEQLRLILEPTQATRLQGDYRSGKRLNMKRLIPYIASEFTKDKIWKRRTRPSDRAYQVLVALDDSKSMADPSMVHLTLQAVALVTSALERLEVGQVAVESFGQQVKVLHDFDGGQVDGKKVLEGLTFGQHKTDYGLLLKTALERFTQARLTAPPSSNGELWQLMLIISDGSMDNFESVRATLRQATQSKVFVVFIIVDSSRNQSGAVQGATEQSILDRRFARVGNNPLTGQLEIQDARYMDLFPFDYYVVIREAQGLPEVLCRTLRQFFEMVQGK